jgi:hypothetical protein
MEIFNVKKYSKPLPDSHQVSGLPLFDWRHVVVMSPASRAAQFVMRRYRIPPPLRLSLPLLALAEARSADV